MINKISSIKKLYFWDIPRALTHHASLQNYNMQHYTLHAFSFKCTRSESARNASAQLLKVTYTVKPVLSSHSKRTPKLFFQYGLSLNAGQKYCRMLQGEHSEMLSSFIKLPFVFKTFVLFIFEWPLKTGFTVSQIYLLKLKLIVSYRTEYVFIKDSGVKKINQMFFVACSSFLSTGPQYF